VNGIKRWWWLLVLVPLVAGMSFVIWAEAGAGPMREALDALASPSRADGVVVTTQDWLVFRPTAQEPTAGLILYPGGRVDPRAYAPPAREIAGEGYLVVIVPMPLNLAFFAPDRAGEVMEGFPAIARWAVGGHSLGGAMAARYAHRQPSAVDGLVLWAGYPAEGNDLSGRDLLVASIYGTEDGLATEDEVEASRPLLPPNTRWVAIEGGNHAQFGWYGPQRGDNPPTVGREAQQQEVVAATVQLLEEMTR
jgi:hypothetical protein